MNKSLPLLAFISLLSSSVFSQVGINTTAPSATLDVNGNVKIRQAESAVSTAGQSLLSINEGTSELTRMPVEVLSRSVNTNNTVFAAGKQFGLNLLSMGNFPLGFRAVNFESQDRYVGSAFLFSNVDNSYTIPSTGVYAIGYDFRYGDGIQSSVLPNSPGIGLVRNRMGVARVIDSKPFATMVSPTVSITISEANLNSIYSFQAGDKVFFGLIGSNALEFSILSSSRSSFYIYKVSE